MLLHVFDERTPKEITDEIKRFCEEVTPGEQPFFVPVRPESGAVTSECHPNVERHVKAQGGEAVYGWIIWQSPAVLHAEFHCNWRSPDGKLIDITPKADGEAEILFLPDQRHQWSGWAVPCRRKARRTDPMLAQFISVMDQIARIQSKYLAGQPVSPIDANRLIGLQRRASNLMLAVSRSWGNSRRPAKGAAERRAEKKAERQRRKQQRRRRKPK